MVSNAKRAMANQTESTEIERSLIQFMETVMRMKPDKVNDEMDQEECTREDLKVEPISDNELQYSNDEGSQEYSQKLSLNAEHISLRDIQVIKIQFFIYAKSIIL